MRHDGAGERLEDAEVHDVASGGVREVESEDEGNEYAGYWLEPSGQSLPNVALTFSTQFRRLALSIQRSSKQACLTRGRGVLVGRTGAIGNFAM